MNADERRRDTRTESFDPDCVYLQVDAHCPGSARSQEKSQGARLNAEGKSESTLIPDTAGRECIGVDRR
jgi:hypothetical protein